MGGELQTTQPQAVQIRETVQTIKARVQLVQNVMREVMKRDVHYGTIPGTPKPTLYKPGAEIIALAFQFAPRYLVDDLSTMESVHYRVTCELYSRENSTFIGSGQGECSSDEEKYKWRKAVNAAEFEATPEDRKRVKFGHNGKTNSDYTINQVRIEPADIANTVLKMGEKRAFIDAIRTASGCSDMFAQDLEDLPPEVRQAMGEEQPQPKPIGAADYKKLVAQAKRCGYTEADLTASAATAGHEGPGTDMPEDVAQRLFLAMKDNPKTTEPPKATADPATGEVIDAEATGETQPAGFKTPLMSDSDA